MNSNDSFNGGTGTDTYSAEDVGAARTINLTTETVQNSGDLVDFENVIGTAFDDSITGDSGNNVIRKDKCAS